MTTLREWWHWFRDMESWRVKYKDSGKTSRRLRLGEARGLAAIFNGIVLFNPERKA